MLEALEALLTGGWPVRNTSDDVDEEDQRGCFLIIAGVLLVSVSGFLAYREIVYLCAGQQADATVLRVYDSPGRDPGTTVDFEFTDPGTGNLRRASDRMSAGWQKPSGPLKVEFVPGSETFARVAGHQQRWALWLFGASLAAAIVYIGMLIREANTPIRRKRRR